MADLKAKLKLKEPKDYLIDAIKEAGLNHKPSVREQKLLTAALAALNAQAEDYLGILKGIEQQARM